MKCKKCRSENLVMRPNAKNPSATEVICGDCGAWQKFISKDEIRLFELRSSQKKLTNADRIRSMNDEELATWILENIDCDKENIMCIPALYKNSDKCDGRCRDGRLSWLKQPLKEE